MRKTRRAQTSLEYMLALSMSVLLVSVIMVGGFKELELQIALGTARMGGEDFVSQNPYFSLGRIAYSQDVTGSTINISPIYYFHGSSSATAQNLITATNMSFVKLRSVFSPGNNTVSTNYCYNATYRSYCISPVLLPV